MRLISLFTLAAVIPVALSRPVLSNSLPTRYAGNGVVVRSIEGSGILQRRGDDGQ